MSKPWFGPMRWGLGIVPTSWQGWVVNIAFALVAGLIFNIAPRYFVDNDTEEAVEAAGFIALLATWYFVVYRNFGPRKRNSTRPADQ